MTDRTGNITKADSVLYFIFKSSYATIMKVDWHWVINWYYVIKSFSNVFTDAPWLTGDLYPDKLILGWK